MNTILTVFGSWCKSCCEETSSVKMNLVNGARGIVVGFTWPDGQPTQPEIGQLPQNLLVKFHNPRVGRISRVSVEDDAEAVPIVNL